MKSKVFRVAASGIDTGEVQQVDVSLHIDSYVLNQQEIIEDVTELPKQIIIDNDSNGIIGYVTISSDDEYSIYEQHPEWFDFIPVRSKVMVNALSAPKTFKILIKSLQPSLSYLGDVSIICIGYNK